MAELTLTQSEKDSSIEVRQGSIIVVRLPENPTTGYRWVIEETDEEILEPESSDFALRPDAGIGGGGERRLRFRTKKSGSSHVELKLARSWEEESSGIDRYGFTIQVR